MKCEHADELMMNYLDGVLSKDQAYQLNQHLQKCDSCVETFYAYEQIQEEFKKMSVVEVPEDFTRNVMSKINKITPQYHLEPQSCIENINGIVWGIFSILFGIGVLLVMYQQELLQFLLNNPYTASWIGQFIPTFDLLADYLVQLQHNINEVFVFVQKIMGNIKNVLIFILIVLGVVQYQIYRKEKVEI
ncbi:MAG: hypothetical protein GX347_04860 [Epulopiscium sp.]|nr:hypothetical protein [Candidatus Epulonipiscium sp.]